MKRYLIVPLLLFLTTGTLLYAQTPTSISHILANKIQDRVLKPSNNIYLQTSKSIYEYDEDFWFKAWVLDSQQHLFSVLDRTLYVTLTKKSNDSIVFEEKYQIINGSVNGYLHVANSWPEGAYRLSAYTAHSLYKNQIPFYNSRDIEIVSDLRKIIHNQTPPPVTDNSKIQFGLFPEGGELVSGLANVLAFKAVNTKGRPVAVSGVLYENNKAITTFKTEHSGMGKLDFVPKANNQYHVVLDQQKDTVYQLPSIKKEGVQLHLVYQTKNKMRFKISQTSNLPNQVVYLRSQTRGMVQFIASGNLKDSLYVDFPLNNFPQGITEVTLFNDQAKPLAERLAYVNLDRGLQIKVTGLDDSYPIRGKVKLNIQTSDKEGNPVPAELAISVFDEVYNRKGEKNILTHYYLSSEIRGSIYNPDYYFNPKNKNRLEALDLLLLTQGWRKYTWDEASLKQRERLPLVVPTKIRGYLQVENKSRNSSTQKMLMLFNSTNNKKQMIKLDDQRKFELDEPYFTLGRRLYLKSFPTKKDRYIVRLNDPFKQINEIMKAKQRIYPLIETAADTTIKIDTIQRWQAAGSITLNEVQINAKKDDGFKDKYMKRLDSIAEAQKINQDYVGVCGVLDCVICGTGEKPVEGQQYPIWVGESPPETHPIIDSFDIDSLPDVDSLFKIDSYFDINQSVNEVAIDTGRMMRVTYHHKKLSKAFLLEKFHLEQLKGYYGKKEFYQPNYDKKEDEFPDYRTTLLWKPSVITDMKGKATVTFYCSDISTHFLGVIEGLGQDGILGRKEFDYRVKNRVVP
ncbi:hypothetical protein [Tenacibaculum sp. UWU-22]|uniref:hypothetical protein n=1 Tax=Tenacibaculum sp. UWU-22 TaxID=3234187 RepID=UPI0034DB40ED